MSTHDQEQAATTACLHGLGLLSGDELAEAEKRRSSDAEFAVLVNASAETLVEIAEAYAVAPPPGLRQRVLSALQKQTQDPGLPNGLVALVRYDQGKWRTTPFPGVTAKRLFSDPQTSNSTWLLKMEAGAVYPSHRHNDHEHCFVIEGEVSFKDYSLYQGDFGVAAAGSEHPSFTTKTGCLLLIVSNDHDEVMV